MNVANSVAHQIHLSFSESTGELTVRKVLSDQTVQAQRAVSGHLTLVGGSYLVDRFGPSLARGALEAFSFRIKLRGTLGQAELRFDNAKWDKKVREQLRFHKRRSSFKNTKVLKIWIANSSTNPTFDEHIVRGALRHGGALPMEPEAMMLSSGYKDLDTVAKGNIVESLDYGESLKPQRVVKENQPIWFDFGHESMDQSEIEQSTAHSSGSGSGLRNQLIGKTPGYQSWKIGLGSKEQPGRLLSPSMQEYITHAQTDISALATALVFEKGIRRGDRQAIGAGIHSVYVGQSTVDRLLKSPFFVSDFLEPQSGATQRRRGTGRENGLDLPSDDDSNRKESGKRTRLE